MRLALHLMTGSPVSCLQTQRAISKPQQSQCARQDIQQPTSKHQDHNKQPQTSTFTPYYGAARRLDNPPNANEPLRVAFENHAAG